MLAETILHAPDFLFMFSASVCKKVLYKVWTMANKLAGQTHLKLSMQSIPLGSAFENTKQLNAARKFSPQGPWAIPPRQGQSQLISPVSSLKAPCWEASSSVSSRDGDSGVTMVVVEVWEGGVAFDWRAAAIDSRVGMEVSSLGEMGGTATIPSH